MGGVSHITTAAATGGGAVTTALAMKPVVIIGKLTWSCSLLK